MKNFVGKNFILKPFFFSILLTLASVVGLAQTASITSFTGNGTGTGGDAYSKGTVSWTVQDTDNIEAAGYDYIISSSGGGGSIGPTSVSFDFSAGTGLTDTQTGIDVSSLTDGTLTLTITLNTANGGAEIDTDASVILDDTQPGPSNIPVLQTASDLGSSNSDGITSTATPTFDVTADEAGSTLTLTSSVDGLIGTSSGTGTITAAGMSSTGATGTEHLMTVNETDLAGNASVVVSPALSVTIDTQAPTVSSINRKAGEDNPTNGSSVIFTVTFNEDLNPATVTTADFDIDIQSGSLSDVVLATAVTGVSTISADVYEVTVDVGSVADEEAVVGLAFDGADGTGAGVDDVAGNTTTGAQDYLTSDETYDVDRIAPTFSFSPVDGSQVTTSPFTVTITFDEPLDDADELVIADLAVTGATGGSIGNFQEIAPNDNTTYTVDITPSGLGATDGGVDITLTLAASAVLDEAGNTNAVGSADYDYNTVPVVTTNAAADIGPTSADLGANVTSNGGRSVSDRGVYWTDDDSDPAVSGTRTLADDGQTGTGSATIQDVPLTSNANIDVKGFGTNDVGTGYGGLEEFVTPPNPTTDAVVLTTVTPTTATLTGSIPEGGGLSLTSYGMAYNTSTAPTTANSYTNAGPGASTGGVTISQGVTGLTSNDVYFVRAYGLNSGAAEAYGNEVSFTTKAAVTTNAPSVINEDDATLDGTVAAGGGETITTTGFVWAITSTNSNPEIGGTGVTNVVVGSGSGALSSNITGLSPGEQYTYKAYAINAGGTSYGSPVTFRADYSLAVGGATSAAEGGTVQFTVSLTEPAAASFTFNYSISGGTGNAVTGGDYTDQRGGSITWPMGSTTETFNVTAIDDAIAEGDETIVLNIEPGPDYTYSGSNPYRSTTIVDNDNTLTITSTAPDLDEGDAGTFTLEFEDATSVERDFTIGYTIDANDTEGAGSDYSAFSGTATIAASGSVTTTDVGFTALDDDFAEIDESFTLNVSSGTALGTNYIGTPSQTATIHDVDFVVTMGTQPNALVEGSGETRDFIIQLEGAPTVTAEQDLVASYNVTYTNVTTADTDIGAGGNIWATISAGQSSTTVTYGEKQDVFAEGDETFYITLTTQRISSFPNEPYTIGTTGTQTATIQDDTDNTVTITASDVTENTASTMFNVAFPTGVTAQRTFTFTYATTYDLADATDHSGITGSVQITSGQNNTSFGTADDDDWAEGDEDVTLTINDGSAVTPKYKRNSVPEDATSTITDVDNVVSIAATNVDEEEATDMFEITFPNTGGPNEILAQRDFTISFGVVDDGTPAVDYTGIGTSQVILQNDNGVSFGRASADDLAEGAEDVVVTITTGAGASPNYQGTPNATSTISDLDNEIEIDAVDVTEEDGTPIFTFSFEDAAVTAERAFTVDYTVTNEAGITSDIDHGLTSGSTQQIIIAATTDGTTAGAAAADNLAEGDEDVTVTLSAHSTGPDYTITDSGNTSDLSTITDIDNVIEVEAVDVTEEDGTPIFTFSFEDALVTAERAFTVDYTIANTLASDIDHGLTSGSTQQIIIAATTDGTTAGAAAADNLAEGDEDVDATVAARSTGPVYTIGTANTAGSTITDIDNVIEVEAVDVTEEDGTPIFTFSFEDALVTAERAFTVDYTIANTLASDIDHGLTSGSTQQIIIAATTDGTTAGAAAADNLAEGDEDVDATVAARSTGPVYTIGTANTAGSTITDIDNVIEVEAVDVTEEDGTPIFTFSFEDALVTAERAFTVDYTIANTLASDIDHGLTSGSTQQIIIAATTDGTTAGAAAADNLAEGDEDVDATVAARSTGPVYTIGTANTAGSTITDIDNVIEVEAVDVTEEDGTPIFTFSFEDALVTAERAFTVDYTIANTLASDIDHGLTSGSTQQIIIAATTDGTTAGAAAADNLAEGDEDVDATVAARSTGPVYTIGTANTAGSTITDIDNVIEVEAVDVTEEDGTPIFTFSFEDALVTAERAFTVDYTIANTLASDIDHGLTSGSTQQIIIAATTDGTTAGAAAADNLAEGDEDVDATVAARSTGPVYTIGTANTAGSTITDIDNVIEVEAVDVTEEDGTPIFTFSFEDALVTAERAFTVDYTIANTLASDIDHGLTSGSTQQIIIAATTDGTTAGAAAADNLAEGDEDVDATVAARSTGPVYTIGTANTAGSTITDIDNVIEVEAVDVTEEDGTPIFTFSFEDALVTAERAFTVDYTIANTLASDIDHGLTSGSTQQIIIAATTDGTTAGAAAADNLAEGDEDVDATVAARSTGPVYTIGTANTAGSTITDIDNVIEVEAVDVTEEDGTPIFTFSFEDALVTAERAFTVDYTIANTLASDIDHGLTSGSTQQIIIAATTDGTTAGAAAADNLAEGDEDVDATVAARSTGPVYTIGTANTAGSTITDIDNVIEVEAVDVTEEDGTPIFTFSFEDALVTAERAFTVDYTIANTLASDIDHGLTSGSTQQIIIAATTDGTTAGAAAADNLAEGDEDVDATVAARSTGPVYTIGTANTAGSTITDIDNVVSVLGTDVTEDDGVDMFTIRFPSGITAERAFTVDYTVAFGVAGAGAASETADHGLVSGSTQQIIIGVSSSNNTAGLAVDDNFAEGYEDVTMTLQSHTTGPNYTLATGGDYTGNGDVDASWIEDVDNIIQVAGNSVTEEDGNDLFTWSFPTGITAQRAFVFQYSVTNGLTSDSDHGLTSTSEQQFVPGALFSSNEAGLGSASADNLAEGDESVTLTIEAHDVGPVYTIGASGSDVATITDIDNVIEVEAVDVTEEDGTPIFTFSFEDALVTAERAFTVDYTIANTLASDIDYGLTSGSTQQIIIAATTDGTTAGAAAADNLAEGDEDVDATVAARSTGPVYTIGTANTAGSTITDIDNVIEVEAVDVTEEDGTPIFTFSFEDALVTAERAFTVDYTIATHWHQILTMA